MSTFFHCKDCEVPRVSSFKLRLNILSIIAQLASLKLGFQMGSNLPNLDCLVMGPGFEATCPASTFGIAPAIQAMMVVPSIQAMPAVF